MRIREKNINFIVIRLINVEYTVNGDKWQRVYYFINCF